jgi:hypothetical protein
VEVGGRPSTFAGAVRERESILWGRDSKTDLERAREREKVRPLTFKRRWWLYAAAEGTLVAELREREREREKTAMDAESENAEGEGTRRERETCFQTLHLMRMNVL